VDEQSFKAYWEREALEEFSRSYLKLLTDDFKGINLTRILDAEEFSIKQIYDSIYPFVCHGPLKKHLLEKKGLLDVGFGGGFPLLPLAKCFPEVAFKGIEARGKKVNVVGQIAEKLSLHNVTLKHIRIEDILIDKPIVITLKAVGEIGQFLEKVNYQPGVSFVVVFYKALEVDTKEDFSSLKGWKLEERFPYLLPNGHQRFTFCFTPKINVPRGTKELKNILVPLSSIL
jgi:16S rRNA (guanine527-N7)-methyltransferase